MLPGTTEGREELLMVAAVETERHGGWSFATMARLAASAVLITAVFIYLALSQTDWLTTRELISQLSLSSFAMVTVALLAGVCFGALRLRIVAADLGYRPSLNSCLAAVTLGQIGGNLFFQIAGQLIARSAVLKRHGLPISATVIATLYERFSGLAVSLGLAVWGAAHLFGRLSIDLKAGGLQLLSLIAGLSAVFAATFLLAWGSMALSVIGSLASRGAIIRFIRVLLMTIVIQLTTLLGFIIAARMLVPSVPLDSTAAACCLVMLASALPISFAGWGIRELSAIAALGAIGFPAPAALAAGLVIGVASLVALFIAALISSRAITEVSTARQNTPIEAPPLSIDGDAFLSWVVPIAAAMAVLFQVHLPVGHGELNVNLADPIAILGGAWVVVRTAPAWPTWRSAHVNGALLLATGAILVGFFHGLLSFGWSNWAFWNKCVGWFVLLAYAATGALIVHANGAAGRTLLLRTLSSAIVAVVVVSVTLAGVMGFDAPTFQVGRIAGFAQDANAFALQMIVCVAIVLTLKQSTGKAACLLSLALVGLWFSGSRSGLIAVAAVTIMYSISAWENLRLIVATIAVAAIAIVSIKFFQSSLGGWDLVIASVRSSAQAASPLSFSEHMESIYGALKIFFDHPIFGAGLGYFMETHIREFGVPMVIHSTPLWLLAELGLLGFACFAIPAALLFVHEWRNRGDVEGSGILLVLLLTGFVVMSQFQDLTYQRVFWLVIGAGLACRRPPIHA
jgi:Lysylphosphatidylglycerol synthase TM region/O-Antigen ligase